MVLLQKVLLEVITVLTYPMLILLLDGKNLKDPNKVDVSFLLSGEASNTLATFLIQEIAESRKDCVAFISPDECRCCKSDRIRSYQILLIEEMDFLVQVMVLWMVTINICLIDLMVCLDMYH